MDRIWQCLASNGNCAVSVVVRCRDKPQIEVGIAAIADMVPHTLKVGVIGPSSVEGPIDAF